MKKLLIAVAVLLIAIAGALVYVYSSLDTIVKHAIESYGSEATKTAVHVQDVRLKLDQGEGAISGLSVGNPAGFNYANIFELGGISMRIDTSSVTKNPVIIEELSISSPAVFYEINEKGLSNVDALKKNLGAGSGRDAEKKSERSGESLRMIVRRLVVDGGKAKLRIAALGGRERQVKLPKILLTDIGKKSGGATAAELAQILSRELLKHAQASVAKAGMSQYLGKPLDQLKQGGNVPVDIGGALKALPGM